jgi:hypothetical protein
MSDPFEEKSRRFFPQERYFWVLQTLAWVFAFLLMNPGYALLENRGESAAGLLGIYLSVLWFAYYVLGTATLLVFRRYYYRQRWYQKKFVGSLPLAIAVAAGGGMVMACLLVLPLNLLMGDDFRIDNEAGKIAYEGAFDTTLYAGYELATILLVWILVYLGVEGAINAHDLALKSVMLQSSLKDARLNALSGQINPHFLFNALNNIRFMIRRDPAHAEDGLVDLSEILRHSLESSQQETTLPSQELLITERYLSLMKIQLQSRLAYSIQSTGVPEGVMVPPMIVQMLAENALKHGIERIRDGGRVDIRCSMESGRLFLEIRNSAVPADVEDSKTDINSKGVGLANVGSRLALLYGDKAKLALSRQDNEFVVRIELPGEAA